MSKPQKKIICVQITKKQFDIINTIVKTFGYGSLSEYLRELIRRDIESRGMLLSYEEVVELKPDDSEDVSF